MTRIRSSLVALLLCLQSQGQAEPGFTLTPAEARYRVRIAGVPTGMDAQIRLEQSSDQQFMLDFTVKHPLIRHQESSHFQWRPGCHAYPLAYSYQSSGFGIRRGGEVSFNWPEYQAEGSKESYPLVSSAVDALGMAMMARCDLYRGRKVLAYDVAEPDGLTQFHYRILGEEELKLPAGTFHTIKVERVYPEADRRTYLWAARELDYFMVRMDHIENAVLRGKMEMISFTPLPIPPANSTAQAGTSP